MLRLARMRSTLALLVLAVAPLAHASDARVEFLSKQLASASDARVRVNAAVGLGALGLPAAIAPLCSALKDPEPLVRSAAARALGELGDPNAAPCLKARQADSSSEVEQAIRRAIATLDSPRRLYVAVDAILDESGDLNREDLALAERLIRLELTKIGATFAPDGQSKAEAQSAIRASKLKGFMLKPKLSASEGGALEIKVMVLTYPEQAIKTAHKVKARGAKPSALIKAMIPKVVGDMAQEHQWK